MDMLGLRSTGDDTDLLACSTVWLPGALTMQIFGGYEHTFALTSDGDVLAFGNGLKGQLGIGNTGTVLYCSVVYWVTRV